MSFGVVIIGLGQIGMGYDLGLPADSYVMTHARAFHTHPDFILLGGVDLDDKRRIIFEAEYGCKAYADIDIALKNLSPDVVVISIPTEFHLNAVQQVLNACSPQAILCEKPLAYELDEAEKIHTLCKEYQCQLLVNYLRRVDPGVLEVKAHLEKGLIASPVKGVAWYSKGLFNNGSHFFDLLQFWLGDINSFNLIEPGRRLQNGDFEPDVIVTFENGPIYFLAGQEEHFSLSGIEFISPLGRLKYENGGDLISWQQIEASKIHPGYTILSSESVVMASDLNRAQWYVVDEIAESLRGKDTNMCKGFEALKVIRWLTQIRNAL